MREVDSERSDYQGAACELCQLRTLEAEGEVLSGNGILAYRDEVLAACVVNGRPGALVAPLSHIEVLSDVPSASGAVLAGLTRAVRAVAQTYQVQGATIEPTAALADAPGHVAYWVIPTARSDQHALPAMQAQQGADRGNGQRAELLSALAEELGTLPPPQGWRVSARGPSAGGPTDTAG